jgi:soluble lytic murein transglycosylase-like protein
MKFFTRMLAAILVLAAGFVLGVKFQARVESRSPARALIDIQKARIEKLRQEGQRLRTALLLRDYLEETRLRIPRATYRSMVDAIADASLRYGVSPETILAVIRIESAFDVDAESEAGAIGLMQILPSTAEEIARELRMSWSGGETLRDPAANIEMGTYYLTRLLGRFNDLSLALAAYNEGPGRIAGRSPEGAGLTTDYARRVLGYATP